MHRRINDKRVLAPVRRRYGKGIAVAAAMTIIAVTAACSSGGSDSARTTTQSPGSASTESTANGPIFYLSGPLSVGDFVQTKAGADAAAQELGINYQYSAPPSLNNFLPDYTALINEAIARHPAAMVIGDFVPSAIDPLIKKAVAVGIPVVVENVGITSWQPDGAIGYVGISSSDEGQAAASAALKAGVKHLLCVDQTTNLFVEQICTYAQAAMQKAGQSYSQFNVPLTDIGNPSALTQDIQGYLHSHPQIDGVFTAGGGFGVDAATAVQNLGETGKVKVGGNEVTAPTLQDIKNGSMSFIIVAQHWLEGFDALQIADQYVRYKVYPYAAISTGGAVIDQSNIAQYLTVVAKYPSVF